jgi:muramoyltetrapeptide carboxypeptidase
VEQGCDHLRAFGYEPVVTPHALSRDPLYYAGTKQERVADLHAAFADDTIQGVLCTRGGWGSAELLPLLDAELVRANPKVFVGYSDHTSLHSWFWNECAMQTYYAPMVAADWSKEDGVDQRTWLASVHDEGQWSVGETDGLRLLRDGNAEGRLLGGCLSLLEAGLGTPWALRVDEPCVLFLEDIGVKPYQWDRMLQHLKFAGLMKNVRGVVFGDMSACGDEELVQAACLHALGDFQGPVSIGLKCGHVETLNRSLPLGAWVKMSGAELSE